MAAHEDLRACSVGQRQRRSGVVDERLLAGAPVLTRRSLEHLGKCEMGWSEPAQLRLSGVAVAPQQAANVIGIPTQTPVDTNGTQRALFMACPDSQRLLPPVQVEGRLFRRQNRPHYVI
jgi:hypothetical protein